MILYIDKDFIIEFESRLRENNPIDFPVENEVNNRLLQIFAKYAGVQLFTDVHFEELQKYYIFKLAVSVNPQIESKETFLNVLSKCNDQTPILAFTNSDKSIADIVTKFNGLVFTTENYISLLHEIIKKEVSFRFAEMNNQFKWSHLMSYLNWRTKTMILVDNFILLNDGKINANLKPLLKSIAPNKFVTQFKILVNRDEYRQNRRADGPIDFSNFENDINEFVDDIDGSFSVKVKTYSKSNSKYDLHDRRLYMRYAIIEIGKGFDLLPIDSNSVSDRKIQIRSIFTKDTHDDFRVFYKGIETLVG